MTEEFRTERDSLGEMEVPVDAYWGAQTQRAVENFPISGIEFDRRFVRALGVVKKSAARANLDLDLLDEEIGEAIVEAADEVIEGDHDDQFPVDVFQTGSGTSSNMNANEVIANRATEVLGNDIGDGTVHPNDHVNFGQSSNDVIPTAMHVSALVAIEEEVLPALETLEEALGEKEEEFAGVVKTGRTHLQDATPVTLGQEFGGYRTQIEKGRARVKATRAHLTELALGGTAVGTGLNTHPEFPELVADYVTEEIGIDCYEADNHFEAQAAHDAMAEASGALRTVAGSLNKIANDLRLLASGPRNGLGEIEQPENQPGSSIMPGKINPVVAEAVNQVHKQVLGNDATIAAGASRGELDLNLYKPVLAHDFLESAKLIANASETFAERFVAKLEANEAYCAEQVEGSMALATALNPHIGYEQAADAAKTALKEGKTVREVAIEKGYVTEEEAEEVLDPMKMTERGILGDDRS
jgi:fumarate hydratase, class II